LASESARGGCAVVASAIALGVAITPNCAHARDAERDDDTKFVAISAPSASLWPDLDFTLAGASVDPAFLELMKVRTRRGGVNVVSSYGLRMTPTGESNSRAGDRSARENWGGFSAPWTRAGEEGLKPGHGVVVRVQRDLEAKQRFDWRDPALSFFVAADSDAVAWRLDKITGNEQQRFYYQSDRVKIGDLEAGLAVEAGRARLGLAYVEREIRAVTPSGVDEVTRDENFVGLTLTFK
jgi:hypothetical protein